MRRTWPPIRRAAIASAAAFVARLRRWWGAASRAGRSRSCSPTSRHAAADAEDSVNEVARAHRGHCRVARSTTGRCWSAFASARGRLRRRPRARGPIRRAGGRRHGRGGAPGRGYRRGGRRAAGSWRWPIGTGPVDDATAEAIDGRLPPELGLAELAGPRARGRAWALVAPGLSSRRAPSACPYRGLMAFQPEDGDLFFGREEVVATTSSTGSSRRLHGRGRRVGEREVVARPGRARPGVRRARERLGRGDDARLGSEAGRACARPGPPSLLVVDQLEEAFTLCRTTRPEPASSTP